MSTRRKALIIFIFSLIAAAIVRSVGGKPSFQSDVYVAQWLGNAGACFFLGMLSGLFIRGIAGAVVGIFVAAVMAYIIGYNNHLDKKSEFPLHSPTPSVFLHQRRYA